MRIAFHGATHVGKKRTNNEDNFFTDFNDRIFLCCVADGMGGHEKGEVASQITCDAMAIFSKEFKPRNDKSVDSLPSRIKSTLTIASEKIFAENRHSGTTVVVLARQSKSDSIALAWCGDSRIYRIRDNKIAQLSFDQSLVGSLVKSGDITKEEAAVHPSRNIILNHIGMRLKDLDIQTKLMKFKIGDIYVLCTDGLNGELTDQQILWCVQSSKGTTDSCNNLISAANLAGGRDNVTVVATQFLD